MTTDWLKMTTRKDSFVEIVYRLYDEGQIWEGKEMDVMEQAHVD
jgi:hypothetical protein